MPDTNELSIHDAPGSGVERRRIVTKCCSSKVYGRDEVEPGSVLPLADGTHITNSPQEMGFDEPSFQSTELLFPSPLSDPPPHHKPNRV